MHNERLIPYVCTFNHSGLDLHRGIFQYLSDFEVFKVLQLYTLFELFNLFIRPSDYVFVDKTYSVQHVDPCIYDSLQQVLHVHTFLFKCM